jgi:hypothetical protein
MSIKHDIHDGKGGKRAVKTTPPKAIRLFCLECMGYQQAEITRCSAPLCPLFPYKMGSANKSVSEKQRKQMSDAARIRAAVLRCSAREAQESTISPECIGE